MAEKEEDVEKKGRKSYRARHALGEVWKIALSTTAVGAELVVVSMLQRKICREGRE